MNNCRYCNQQDVEIDGVCSSCGGQQPNTIVQLDDRLKLLTLIVLIICFFWEVGYVDSGLPWFILTFGIGPLIFKEIWNLAVAPVFALPKVNYLWALSISLMFWIIT